MNEDDLTPAHQAAIEGSVRCLEALIKANAAIDLPDDKGHIPLDYAKIWGHRRCARYVKKSLKIQSLLKCRMLNVSSRLVASC